MNLAQAKKAIKLLVEALEAPQRTSQRREALEKVREIVEPKESEEGAE